MHSTKQCNILTALDQLWQQVNHQDINDHQHRIKPWWSAVSPLPWSIRIRTSHYLDESKLGPISVACEPHLPRMSTST